MRRRRPDKRTILPDPIYNDIVVAKFVNYIMKGGKKSIAERIFYSCTKFPEITGGSNSINCILTKLSKGKIFFKNGAEGVFVAIIPEQKSALAVKIADGTARAAEVAIAGLISEQKIINKRQIEKFKKRPVTNSANQVIGHTKWLL